MSWDEYRNNDRLEQEKLDTCRTLIEDATKDTVLWLQANPSTEERVHVPAIQGLLADLARIIERQMERRRDAKDDWVWSETVREVLSRLDKAGEARGNIVGKGLARLADRLPKKVPGGAATLADQFGISKDALSEIEETVYSRLDGKALMIEGGSVWQKLKHSTPPGSVGRGMRACLADNVAREAASRLRPLFIEAACEYAEMLTRTIVDHHQQDRPPVHWKAIADRTVEFCVTLTSWEKSARWLYGPLKAAGLDWKDISPRARPAFLTALSAWMLVGPRSQPSLSNEPEVEGVPDLLRRKIRHIARLAREKKQITNGPRPIIELRASEWQGFHERFMQLAKGEEQIERAAPKDRLLRAYCTYKEHPEVWEKGKPEQGLVSLLKTPECGVWMLSDGVSENFAERFQTLAARAGLALGSPKDTDPVDFWLHHLFLNLRENNSDQLFAASAEGGMILRVCEASATFCARLERKAVTGEVRLKTDGEQAESSCVQNNAKSTQDVENKFINAATGNTREAFLRPILDKKGFSVHDWARRANVDFHTADNYLKGKTKPYPDTLKKLADALGTEVEKLPV